MVTAEVDVLIEGSTLPDQCCFLVSFVVSLFDSICRAYCLVEETFSALHSNIDLYNFFFFFTHSCQKKKLKVLKGKTMFDTCLFLVDLYFFFLVTHSFLLF